MRITADKSKLEIIDRLVKDGAISLAEGLLLLEVETIEVIREKEVFNNGNGNITIPWSPTVPYRPTITYLSNRRECN